MTIGAETGVMWQKLRNTKDCQQTRRTCVKNLGQILPESCQTAPTPRSWTSSLWNCEGIHFCPLVHLLCRILLQLSYPTNPVRKSTYQNISVKGSTWTDDNTAVPSTSEASECRAPEGGFTGEPPSGGGPRNCASPRCLCFCECPN